MENKSIRVCIELKLSWDYEDEDFPGHTFEQVKAKFENELYITVQNELLSDIKRYLMPDEAVLKKLYVERIGECASK